MDPLIVKVYSQGGGDLPYFVGKQYGTGWLTTIGKYAFPILKRLFHIASNTAEDVLVKERPVMSSLKEHAIKEVKDTVKRGLGRKVSINRRGLKRAASKTTPPLFAFQKRKKSRRGGRKHQRRRR